MIISGVIKYFKSLSVGGSTLNAITGFRKKTFLYYADQDVIDTARKIELDATVEFKVTLDTDLMKTPAENQKVYTTGALKKPKRIDIQAHVDVVKLEELNRLYENTTPVWVLCSKNMAGAITQVGYYADGAKYGIQSIVYNDTGYDNTVAVTISLEELRMFTYDKEYTYDVSKNKVIKKSKSDTNTSGAKATPQGYNAPWRPKADLTPNQGGGR